MVHSYVFESPNTGMTINGVSKKGNILFASKTSSNYEHEEKIKCSKDIFSNYDNFRCLLNFSKS